MKGRLKINHYLFFHFFSRFSSVSFFLRKILNPYLFPELAMQPAQPCTPTQNLMSDEYIWLLEICE